jgi:hypothetical protein
MNGHRRGLALRLSIATALAISLLPVMGSAAAADSCAARMEYVTLNTLHVDVAPLKKSYRKGDVVKLKVRVSRPSENDPVGLGISMDRPFSEPAADVNVGVGLSIGRVFLPGYSLTDESGRATVRIKIERYAPSGKVAHVQVFAYMERANTPCLVVEEQGYEAMPNAFRVKP